MLRFVSVLSAAVFILSTAAAGCQVQQAAVAVRQAQAEVVATAPVAAERPLVADYSRPEAVLDLFYQLVIQHRWEDAYSLLTSESKQATKLGDFVQLWAANDGRVQLTKVETVSSDTTDPAAAHLYCLASWDQAYPKVSKFQSYFVRTLVREGAAWRLRWRGPQDQYDLARQVQVDQAQSGRDLTFTLQRVVLLEGSTHIFFTLTNQSEHAIQMDPDLARVVLEDGRTVPLETVREIKLGLRTLEPGQKRDDVLIFRALEPSVNSFKFDSPQCSLGSDTWNYSFSVQLAP